MPPIYDCIVCIFGPGELQRNESLKILCGLSFSIVQVLHIIHSLKILLEWKKKVFGLHFLVSNWTQENNTYTQPFCITRGLVYNYVRLHV